jgi:proteasome-associated ATPase
MEALEIARKTIKEQDLVLKTIVSRSINTGVVVHKNEDNTCLTIFRNALTILPYNPRLELIPGTSVKIFEDEEVLSISAISQADISQGVLHAILEIKEKQIIVENGGIKKSVFPPKEEIKKTLKVGDQVFVYNDLLIIDKYDIPQVHKTDPTSLTWEDIGGLHEIKEYIKDVVETPILYKKLYKDYNQKLPKGILLYGPPGNGKTMIGKAIATSLNKTHGSDGFFYVKGPELLAMWVGVAEENIRKLFKQSRDFYDKHGSPGVIFIDEAEALLSVRGSGKSSDVNKTIVPQFLTEMDGINESKTLVILATNRVDMLDSAVIRDGRIDKKVRVPNPDKNTARGIVGLNLRGVKLNEVPETLQDAFCSTMYSENFPLYNITFNTGDKKIFHFKDIVSGAMIANIVSVAIQSALKRDISENKTNASGIQEKDIIGAIENVFLQHKGISHTDQIESHIELSNLKIIDIKKL